MNAIIEGGLLEVTLLYDRHSAIQKVSYASVTSRCDGHQL